MPYQVTSSDPIWTATDFNSALEKGVATFAKSQGIATQTAYTAFRNGLTTAQAVAVVQRLLDTVTCSVP